MTRRMRSGLLLFSLLFLWSTGLAQQSGVLNESGLLAPYDSTDQWQYPYEVSSEWRQVLIDALNEFEDFGNLRDLVSRLGRPDLVEDLSKPTQPLSPFDVGFVIGSRGRLSYRLIWFAKKLGKSPSLSDNFLVAYVGLDKTTLVAVRGNRLK